jgi:hypothetical protein
VSAASVGDAHPLTALDASTLSHTALLSASRSLRQRVLRRRIRDSASPAASPEHAPDSPPLTRACKRAQSRLARASRDGPPPLRAQWPHVRDDASHRRTQKSDALRASSQPASRVVTRREGVEQRRALYRDELGRGALHSTLGAAYPSSCR